MVRRPVNVRASNGTYFFDSWIVLEVKIPELIKDQTLVRVSNRDTFVFYLPGKIRWVKKPISGSETNCHCEV